MATLKQRLHRKNSSGTYDTIHLETGADCITGTLGIAHGGTGLTASPSLLVDLASDQTTNVLQTSPRPGCGGILPIARGGTGVTNIDALKSALGIGGGSGSLVGMSYNLTGIGVGKPVRWANDIWTCVHQNGSTYYLAATSIYCITQFGSSVTYTGSTLAAMCTHVQNITPQDSLDLAINTSVNGVTDKIFVASYEQLVGGFSYFTNNTKVIKRQCDYTYYWTSSAYDSSSVWFVSSDGGFGQSYSPMDLFGFRPFVALQL